MNIIELKIEEVKPYEKNPRKNDQSVDKVANSIKEFGFKVPIVIDKNNIIVCGHTRYKAAKKLGLSVVPCVVADDLNEEQIKAYRLADNKVGEDSLWDMDLLNEEIADIYNINMSDFDFDIPNIIEIENEEKEEYYGAERERTFEAYNLYEVDKERLSSKWQMPVIRKCNHIPKDLISFNYAKTSKEHEKGIHFYIDDYQFERIWNAPHNYMDILKKFDCVLTPDFSLYTEMPLPMKMWNVYRSRLIGQIMQDYNIKVIPTLQWCEEDSFEFVFEGIEEGGTVSVSTIGVKKDEEALKIWIAGMDKAIEIIKPKTIIVYGGDIGYDFKNCKAIYINNHNTERISNAN